MEWLKEFIKGLPLEDISEVVADVVAWWSEQVKDIPANELPLQAYVGGSLLVCILWFFIARVLPRPLGGMSWIVVIAVLFTPGTPLGDSADIVPACIAVAYAILMKDYQSAVVHGLPILIVIVAGFFLGFVWQLMRLLIFQNKQKKAKQKRLQQSSQQPTKKSPTPPSRLNKFRQKLQARRKS